MKDWIKDKIGGEKIFSIWWFFVVAIVAIMIAAGVFVFFSSGLDIREPEAIILSNKLVECFVEEGFLKEEILDIGFNVMGECKLNSEVFSKGSPFYFGVSFNSFEEGSEKIRSDIFGGDSSFETNCGITGGGEVKAENFPKCVRRDVPVLYVEEGVSKKGVLEILTASNNKGGKVI